MKQFLSRLIGKNYSVKGATALLAITALLSNVLGLLRNVVFYHVVSPSQLDVYFASFRLPDLIFNVLILGAISSAFIPIITQILSKDDKKKVWEISNQVISWITACFIVLAVIMFAAMPQIMHLVVYGFDTTRFEQAVLISRILLLQSIFFAWSWTFGGILNGFRRFSTYAVAPLLYNLSIIVGGFLARYYGINAIAWSVVLGAALHMSIQYWEVRRLGYNPKIDLRWTKEVKEVITLMIPRSISQGITQLELIILTSLGSGLMNGSIAVFSGMNDLQTTPTVVIANSLAVAFFPALTTYAAVQNWGEMQNLLNKVVRVALFLLLPSITLCLMFRTPLIQLYTNGHLTNLAIPTFAWFMIGVIPAALVVILAKVYYGFKDTRTPLILNTVGAVAGTLSAIIGIRILHGEIPVLAMANSIESWVQCILYLYFLHRLQPGILPLNKLFAPIGRYLGGAVVMALAGWLALKGIHLAAPGSTTIILLVQLVLGGLIAVLAYYLYSRIMQPEEIQWLKSNVFTKRR